MVFIRKWQFGLKNENFWKPKFPKLINYYTGSFRTIKFIQSNLARLEFFLPDISRESGPYFAIFFWNSKNFEISKYSCRSLYIEWSNFSSIIKLTFYNGTIWVFNVTFSMSLSILPMTRINCLSIIYIRCIYSKSILNTVNPFAFSWLKNSDES